MKKARIMVSLIVFILLMGVSACAKLVDSDNDWSTSSESLSSVLQPSSIEYPLSPMKIDVNESEESAKFAAVTAQEHWLTSGDYFADWFIIMADEEQVNLLKTSQETNESQIVYSGQYIHAVQRTTQHWYFVDSNHILRLNSETTQLELVYTAEHNISLLESYNEILYFIANDKLYHISPTRVRPQSLLQCKDADLLTALSSTKVVWGKTNPDAPGRGPDDEPVQSFEPTVFYYLYDALKDAQTEISYDEYRLLLHAYLNRIA